jgi:hypothetical protein
LIGRLAIRKQNQEVAGLSGVLLLRAERSIPIDRLVENLNDLLAAQYRHPRAGLIRCASGARPERDGGNEGEQG